jgi:hypothetical protein
MIDYPLEDGIWSEIGKAAAKGSVFVCGDFNLTPSQLDNTLNEKSISAKRIPYTGEYHSFRRWDSIRNVMQRSSIDHLVWNGTVIPTCTLAADGFFCLDHIPTIVNTKCCSKLKNTVITKMRRNPNLKHSDKGACRKFVNRTLKQATRIDETIGITKLSL